MRREKSLRIGVHHANAVVWEPVYRTHLTYSWNHIRAPPPSPIPPPSHARAILSTLVVACCAAQYGTPRDAHARTAARSPSGCAMLCIATGATRSGVRSFLPRPMAGADVDVSTSRTSTRTRGHSVTSANADAFARSVDSVSAPGDGRAGEGREERKVVKNDESVRSLDVWMWALIASRAFDRGGTRRTAREVIEVLAVHDPSRRALEVVQAHDAIEVDSPDALAGGRHRKPDGACARASTTDDADESDSIQKKFTGHQLKGEAIKC